MKRVATILLLTLTALILPTCTLSPGQNHISPAASILTPLSSDTTIGQTWRAYAAGLHGIDLFLTPGSAGDGMLSLHLRSSSLASSDLAVSRLPLSAVEEAGFYHFSFAPQHNSRHHDYYLLLQIDGSGSVAVSTTPTDSDLDGALYYQGVPHPDPIRLEFRPAYDPTQRVLGAVQYGLRVWLPVLLVSVALYIMPGWALLTLLWPATQPLLLTEKAGIAAGLSLAIYPLLMLWSHLVGLHLGSLYAWGPAVLALLALLWHHRTWRPAMVRTAWRHWRRPDACGPDVALLIVLGIIFGVRLAVVAPLEVPLWGDSYHHTMIAQLIVDNGGLFDSWQPYADLTTFTYHFGFHAAVTAFHWVSGSAMPQTVLWVGQVLNGLAVLAIYPLTLRIGGNRWAGVVAVLIVGLLSPMPMFYLNWGRYTQLTGQVILPAAVCLTWVALATPQHNWRIVGLACIVLGGLALTHYRVLVFFAPFLVAFFLAEVGRGTVRPLLTKIAVVTVGGGLLALPWYLNILAGKLAAVISKSLVVTASQPDAAKAFEQLNAVGNLSTYLPMWVWLLFLPAAGCGLWRREHGVVVMCLWWFVALLIVNPQWLHLPGAGLLTNFALFIAAYILVGVIIGAAAGWLIGARVGWRRTVVLVFGVAIIGAWGAVQRTDDIRIEQHALVTPADLRAFAWVEEHTPDDARFLVNTFFTYNGTVVVGSDGGWWLPLLAERETMLPPSTYNSEQGPDPAYQSSVNQLAAAIHEKGLEHPDALALLHERGITHIYIGQRRGRVNYIGPQVLDIQTMLTSPHFHLIYQQDRVAIFELLREEQSGEE